MFSKRHILIIFTLILVFLIIFPGMALAQDSTTGTQQNIKTFRVMVGEKGFNDSPEILRLEVEEGQEVEITFVYADNRYNPHRIRIAGYNIDTGVLDQDNPEVTVRFIANRTGEVIFNCVLLCGGHENLQGGIIAVRPAIKTGVMPTIALSLKAPDQAETGQTFTLTASTKDERGEPVAGSLIKFLVESNFFVNGLMQIGEAVTNERGVAKFDFVPNQPGALRIVAQYELESGANPIEQEKMVNITGSNISLYQTRAGINFPYGFYLWILFLVSIVVGIWGTFLYVLYQVMHISRGTGTKGVSLTLMLIVLAMGTMLVLVLITSPNTTLSLLP